MSLANKRQEMMLAQTRQRYVADQDRISRGLHETHIQVAGGILAQAREEVRVGVGDALGGTEDAFAVGSSPMPMRISRTARWMRSLSTPLSASDNPLTPHHIRQLAQVADDERGLGSKDVAPAVHEHRVYSHIRAPLMSVTGSLPTWTTLCLSTPLASSASSKILGSGFSTPETAETTRPSK